MDNRLDIPYPHIGEVVTKKANTSNCWNSWYKRDSRCIGKSVHGMQDVKCSERINPSNEVYDASFREKLLA